MKPDLWDCYEKMFFSRTFEAAVTQVWLDGKISGEMHLSTGEEALTAGTVLQLKEGDAMALDHRGTAAMLMRGVDPLLLLREFMGQPDGLCHGQGGHMHLFSKSYLVASSGIVGASGPAAAGFALANKYLRPGRIALAFFGEGAMNQGMLLEAMNLAVAWKLPVIFICKDNQWSITTLSASVTGGRLTDRAAGFGMRAVSVDGRDVESVWKAAAKSIKQARKGRGPSFIHATCTHPEGHFLGDPLLRIVRHPVREMKKNAGPIIKSTINLRGASVLKRSSSLATVSTLIGRTAKGQHFPAKDPIALLRRQLERAKDRLEVLENEVVQKNEALVKRALGQVEG